MEDGNYLRCIENGALIEPFITLRVIVWGLECGGGGVGGSGGVGGKRGEGWSPLRWRFPRGLYGGGWGWVGRSETLSSA